MNNEQPRPTLELSIRQTLSEIREFARREPVQTFAAAVGIGLFINMLPSRMVTGTVAIVGATIVRPVLLSLGVTKAMELCCQQSANSPQL